MTQSTKVPSIAYVLLSGGADSTTCLYLACKEFGTEHVRAVSFDYGQRHAKEMLFAKRSCDVLGVPHSIIALPHIVPKTLLTSPEEKVPDISYADIKGVSPSYVPFRNGLMMSVLASHIHGTLINEGLAGKGIKVEHALYMGAHAEDAQNWAYPDCTFEFLGAMATAIFVGTYQQLRLHTPLVFMKKSGVISLGDSLGVAWENTWSCYKGEKIHCGTCPTCLARKQAFIEADVTDPTIYAA